MRSRIASCCPRSNHRFRVHRWAIRLILAATICSSRFASTPIAMAQTSELKVQEPWVYTYRTDEANNTEFMATTPAAEDSHIWLLLACKNTERIYISLIDPDGFPFPLSDRGHLAVHLDVSEAISLPITVIQQKQMTADPRSTKELIPVLMRSNRLYALIADADGVVHTYSFSLQPNNESLRDIDIHCQPNQ